MAFRFKRKESLTKAVRRIFGEGLKDALEALKNQDRLEAVHSVRKEIKKLRALLRLVRAGISQHHCHAEVQCLRQAARNLSAPRDAHVTFQAFESLVEHYARQLAPHSFVPARKALRRHCREESRRFIRAEKAKAVSGLLRKVGRRMKSTEVGSKSWNVLSSGLKRSYNGGRKAQKLALRAPAPENFHEWRKRVKELGYHLRLLCSMWPEQMQAAIGELKAMSDGLGDDHDLSELAKFLAQNGRGEGEKDSLDGLAGLIELRQRELRDAALGIGGRFYAETPTSFCRRLSCYWKQWRRKPRKTRFLAELVSRK